MESAPAPQAPAPSPLGSLAQASRAKELKVARWIMIIVGLLILGLHIFMFTNAENEVETLDRKMRQQGMYVIDKPAVVKAAKVIYAIASGIGAVIFACGLFVYRAPVVATVTGLVLYVGNIAAGVVLSPGDDKARVLFSGILIKVIIIVCLVKAIQAAVVYQREMRPVTTPPQGPLQG